MQYKDFITDVPNWPAEGVLFKDITPLLVDRKVFNLAVDDLSVLVEELDVEPNLIAGIESRGFIFGSAVATINGNGFVPVRKEGKLPPPTEYIDSTKEYGNEVLEVKTGTGAVSYTHLTLPTKRIV